MNAEDDLVAWLEGLQPEAGAAGPGDDAAILGRGAQARAVTADQQIAGVHLPADLDAAVWARRLLAVNLSDLAAMGAQPRAAVLTLAVPAAFPVRRFLRAAVEACREAGIRLAGGDVARATEAVTTMTLIGGRPRGGRWLFRRDARAGDRLWLGGSLGGSACGQRLVARGARLTGRGVSLDTSPELSERRLSRLARGAVRRHLAPTPQLAIGRLLGRRARCGAIDVSDGLVTDLRRLCRASAVGAVVDAAALPIDEAAAALAPALGESALDLALGGGEDYVLLFALPAGAPPPRGHGCVAIGRIVEGEQVRVEREGEPLPLPEGWDHLAGTSRAGP